MKYTKTENILDEIDWQNGRKLKKQFKFGIGGK